MKKKKIWYVTGASKGLGLSLVKKLLADGYRVAATSRDRSSLQAAVGTADQELFLPLEVDLMDPGSVTSSLKTTVDVFGGIDVVVNNAGYGIGGTLEELTMEEISQSFKINLYGVVHVLQAALPYLRQQRSGHIINISSMFGYSAGYGWAVYSSTKFAVTGLSEGLAKDLEPLGIHVTTVAPGAFRTRFLDKDSVAFPSHDRIPDYDGIKKAHEELMKIDGKQQGDPEKAAEVIIGVAEHPNPPVHLVLGSDAYQLAIEKIKTFTAELEEWKAISYSTDFKS